MELKEKAWVINSSNWNQPYFANDTIYYGGTSYPAKKKAFSDLGFGILDRWMEPLTIHSLKMKRQPASDMYLIGGELKTRARIMLEDQIKFKNEELDNILLQNPPTAMAYIRKGGYYYRPNNCGYTEYIIEAGVYPLTEAISSVRNTGYYDHKSAIVIDPVVHNKMINDKIKELKSKLIYDTNSTL